MWADDGECDKTPDYMHSHCKKACKLCTPRFKGARTRSELEVHPLTVTGVMIASFRDEILSDAARLAHDTETATLAATPSSAPRGADAFKPSRRHAAAAVPGTTGHPAGYALLFNLQLVLLGVLLGVVARMGRVRWMNHKSA